MHVSVVKPGELDADLQRLWKDFQYADETLANAFLDVRFAIEVGRVREDARVAVIEDAAETVGFFAYEAGRSRIGRPIGAGACDCQALIMRPGRDVDPHQLLRGAGLAMWEFDHVVAS